MQNLIDHESLKISDLFLEIFDSDDVSIFQTIYRDCDNSVIQFEIKDPYFEPFTYFRLLRDSMGWSINGGLSYSGEMDIFDFGMLWDIKELEIQKLLFYKLKNFGVKYFEDDKSVFANFGFGRYIDGAGSLGLLFYASRDYHFETKNIELLTLIKEEIALACIHVATLHDAAKTILFNEESNISEKIYQKLKKYISYCHSAIRKFDYPELSSFFSEDTSDGLLS